MQTLLPYIHIPNCARFENFITAKNTEVINSILLALQGNTSYRFLFLWGESGSGKTHLLKSAQQACTLPLHCIDDVQLLNNDEQISLFNLYNQLRYQEEGILLVTGDQAPHLLNIREDLATRLAWGLSYQLQPLSDDEKKQALQVYAHEQGMFLSDEVIAYCLLHLRRDLSTLMIILERLSALSLMKKKELSIKLLKEALGEITLGTNSKQ